MSAIPTLLQASGRAAWQITRQWDTSILQAPGSAAEQRRHRLGRPTRRVGVAYAAGGRPEDGQAQGMLLLEQAMMDAASPDAGSGPGPTSGGLVHVPLWPHRSLLGAGVTAGATSLTVDTTLRPFHADAYGACGVLIATPANRPGLVNAEHAAVSAVSDTTLTLSAGLANAYAAGAWVIPTAACLPNLDTQATWLGGVRATGGWVMDESVGPGQAPAVVAPGSLPAGFDVYDGLPILAGYRLTANAAPIGVARDGLFNELGLGFAVDLQGPRGRRNATLPLGFTSRADAWAFLGFFDSRAGSCYPFWWVDHAAELRLVSIDSTTAVTVGAIGRDGHWGAEADAARWHHLALVLTDGSVQVLPVTAAVRTDDQDALTLGAAITGGVGASDVRLACVARRSRFAEDTLVETWRTQRLMSTSVGLIEVVNEDDVDNSISPLTTTGLVSSFDPQSCAAPLGEPPSPEEDYWWTGTLRLNCYSYKRVGEGATLFDGYIDLLIGFYEVSEGVYNLRTDPDVDYFSGTNDLWIDSFVCAVSNVSDPETRSFVNWAYSRLRNEEDDAGVGGSNGKFVLWTGDNYGMSPDQHDPSGVLGTDYDYNSAYFPSNLDASGYFEVEVLTTRYKRWPS